MDPFVLVFAALFSVAALSVGARFVRTQRALREPIGSDVCVACGGTAVSTFAPECHRCDTCRFVWGDGLAARAAAERSARIQALSPAERVSFALRELGEADARLEAAAVALEHAGNQLGLDMLAGGGWARGDMYSRARNEGVVSAAS